MEPLHRRVNNTSKPCRNSTTRGICLWNEI
ncbi:hypothetical protein RDI58_006389 [Solanum bulbocastanum]|uniref:Uncharacterized protein n=1 Tax=Solanum bulbocastanum TaxID=147425 RepID=A0AAN8YNI1_SOLBU